MLPDMDGLKLAQFIRKRGLDSEIVFITEHGEYSRHGYAVKAFDFLLKPVSYLQLSAVLKRFINERSSDEVRFITLNNRGHMIRLNLRDVDYIESSKRKLKVYTSSESYEFYSKLSDLESKLEHHFVRTHQSYLVNRDKVSSFSTNQVHLSNGKAIPLSRRYHTDFKERLNDYCCI